MKNHWTHKECDTIISMYKNQTAYFGDTISGKPITFDELYEIFRIRMGFGVAETHIIIASLIKCGAKII